MSFSILNMVLKEYTQEQETLMSLYASLLSIGVLTKFLNIEKENIDNDDILETVQYYENNNVQGKINILNSKPHRTLRFEGINVDKTIPKEQLDQLLNSISMYVNENFSLKRVYNVWATALDEFGTIDVSFSDNRVNIKVAMGQRTPYTSSMYLTRDRKTPHGFTVGKKDLEKDYGFQKQYDFIKKIFGYDIIHDNVVDNYNDIADNNGNPTSESIFEATKFIYESVSVEMNKVINGDDSLIKNITQGVKNIVVGDECGNSEIIKIDNDMRLYSLNYDNLKNMMTHSDMKCVVKPTKAPILSIGTADGKKELFRIRTRKEKYVRNTTQNRYKVYLEPSDSLSECLIASI